MKYKITFEGHEGVASCEETCVAVVESDTPEQAIAKYAATDPSAKWIESWGCFVVGQCRKILATEDK
jgi:hypothetical protein